MLVFIHRGNVDRTIQDRSRSSTWVSSSLYPSNYGKLYREILTRYGWTTVGVVLHRNAPPIYVAVAPSVSSGLKAYGFTVQYSVLEGKSMDEVELEMGHVLRALRSVARG